MYREPQQTKAYKELLKNLEENNDHELPAYAWPGGYPLFYITADSGALCPKCVNENRELTTDKDDPQWYIVAYDVNYESTDLYCDHCNEQIESAYGDDDENTDDDKES